MGDGSHGYEDEMLLEWLRQRNELETLEKRVKLLEMGVQRYRYVTVAIFACLMAIVAALHVLV